MSARVRRYHHWSVRKSGQSWTQPPGRVDHALGDLAGHDDMRDALAAERPDHPAQLGHSDVLERGTETSQLLGRFVANPHASDAKALPLRRLGEEDREPPAAGQQADRLGLESVRDRTIAVLKAIVLTPGRSTRLWTVSIPSGLALFRSGSAGRAVIPLTARPSDRANSGGSTPEVPRTCLAVGMTGGARW